MTVERSTPPGWQQADGAAATARRPRRWLRISVWLSALAVVFTATYMFLVWPWIARWGATDAEATMGLPGDDLIAGAGMQTTQVVDVDAPASAIWPWLVQMGVDRAGMYSYEWVENLMGLHVRNADRIVPEWQELQVGDFMRYTPPDYFIPNGPGNYVMEIAEPEHLIFCSGQDGIPLDECLSTWQFVLREQGDGTTRLILRARSVSAGAAATLMQAPLFLMQRRMLLGIQARAEAHAQP